MFALSKASCALRSVLRMQQSLYSTSSVLMEKFNIVVPPMGESVKSGTLVQWEKSVGDFVNLDDVVAVIETDKVSMDVRCDKAGYLVKTLVQPDETVKVGSVIAEMDTEKK